MKKWYFLELNDTLVTYCCDKLFGKKFHYLENEVGGMARKIK